MLDVMTARNVSLRRLISTSLVLLLSTAAVRTPDAKAPLFRETVLGASLFRAAWGFRHDRPWLEAQLAFLADHGFTAIRALGTVGHPTEPGYWDGREIDWRWPDYDEVIAGLTDLAFDQYGLRVQWTIFADAQHNIPAAADRARLVERFIAMSRGREEKILSFEVANEFWQNGFDGDEGVAQLRGLSARLRAATRVPVAASAHRPELCALYAAGAVDFATVHFDRGASHSRWSPLTEPWRTARRKGRLSTCDLPEVASNNEPLGPGSSATSLPQPADLVISAVNTYIAGLPIYMLHTGPGVRDDPAHPGGLRPTNLFDLPRARELFEGLSAIQTYVPHDVFTWTPVEGDSPARPFQLEGVTGVSLAARRGNDFIATVAGAAAGAGAVTARAALRIRVIDVLSGEVVQARDLEKGERLVLDRSPAVLVGTMGASAP